jgi:selenocysteine lyase/cysteine desulfurase
MPSSSRELWQWLEPQVMLDAQVAYFDFASVGPVVRSAMVAEYRAREAQSFEVPRSTDDERWAAESTRLATRVGGFVGCDADEIAFTRGAGEALGMVANGLDLASGDEIITTSIEHPAAISPWLVRERRAGIVVKRLELPIPVAAPEDILERFKSALSERTRVACFSHVQYADGTLLPIKELCEIARAANVMTVIDGAQSVGMLNLELRGLGCDFFAGSFHKWLCGSHGTGFLYVRREALDRLWPVEPRSIDSSPPLRTPTTSPGQTGVPAALHKLGNIVPRSLPALRGVEAALDLHDQVGRARIEARVRELAIYARLRLQRLSGIDFLTPARPGLWGGILTFRFPTVAATELVAGLARVRVYVRNLNWPDPAFGALRASFHAFTSHDEIERLAEGLQPFLFIRN